MAKQGLIEIIDATESGGDPQLGLGVADTPDLPDKQYDRLGREMGQGEVLIDKATRAQLVLLRRLVAAGPAQTLRFPFIATLRRFLAATKSFDDAKAAALSDDALAKRWRDAETAG